MTSKQLRTIILLLITWAANGHAQTFKVFFGDLHQHSTLSWDHDPGALAPDRAFDYAKSTADLGFLAITDHANDLNAGRPLEGWQELLDAAAQATDSQFVALASQEVGVVSSRGYGHLVVHDSPDLAENGFFPNVRFDLDEFYDFIIARNSLAHFCHPGIVTSSGADGSSKFNNFAYHPNADAQVYGVEVLSGFNSTMLYERYYLLALENGWHVGAVTAQDNHRGNYGNRLDSGGNINLTGVLLDTLSRSKLLDAFRNRRTYAFQASPASDRIFLTEFTADGHWMGEVFDNEDNIVNLTISAHAQGKFIAAHLYKNGILLKRFEPDANQFTWSVADSASFGSVYYFVKLLQEDTDVLWSSPIWVNSAGQYQPPTNRVTRIADLRENFANGLPRSLGLTNVTIRGVATAGRQLGFDGPGFLQDSTGAIAIFGSGFVEKVIPSIPFEFEVTGRVSFFNGQTEITPFTTQRLGSTSFPVPRPINSGEITSNGEAYEGELVRVLNAEITGIFPPSGVNANLTISDGSGPCTLRIDRDTDIDGTATPSGRVNIVGIVTQFDTSPPYDSGYQMTPRSLDDIEIVTSIENPRSGLVEKWLLNQNYPNPFNPETKITYAVPVVSRISLKVYNMSGQLIRTLVDKEIQPGEYSAIWDGTSDSGQPVASGVYFYKLASSEFSISRKLVLIK